MLHPLRRCTRRALRLAAVAWLAAAVADIAAAPLPVETFFKKPQYGSAVLSPSGQYLAVVTPINGRHNAGVIDLKTLKFEPISSLENGDVYQMFWQNDDRIVLVITDFARGTGEPPQTFGMVAVNRDGTAPRRFGFPLKARWMSGVLYRVELVGVILGTNDVLLGTHERTEHSQDLYRFNTLTGNKTLLSFDSPGNVIHWIVDFDSVPRAAITEDLDHDKSAWYVRSGAGDPWRKVEEVAIGTLQSEPKAFTPDGKTLYVESRRDADRVALYEYEVATGQWKGPVVAHAERDINVEFVSDVQERKLFGFRYVDDKPSALWFDADWARMQKAVDAALPDTVNTLQYHGGRWIVVAVSDRNPGDVYLLDGKSMKMEKLFSYEPDIHAADIAPTRWVRYPARDGLSIPALLTVPPGSEGKRVPLIVKIHGGPNVPASQWEYDTYYPDVPFFASRGYAVLQPQFRGTEGFGWKLESAGFRKWGDQMQDDLEDGVKWAVAQGIADADRICFFGASYGGYAAMWGAIKNAKLIKCAVAFVGVSSIDYLFDNATTDLSEFAQKSNLMADRIGDPKTERARFKRVNPLDNADKVGVPILLAYGGLDRRVPMVHGTDFRAALDKYGKPYEWVVYAEEGHGFNRDENLFDFYHRVEAFLAKYLGPAPAATAAKTQ